MQTHDGVYSGFKRVSQNPEWYIAYREKYGKVPTSKEDLRNAAKDIVSGELPGIEFFADEDALNSVKTNDSLDKIASVMKDRNGEQFIGFANDGDSVIAQYGAANGYGQASGRVDRIKSPEILTPAEAEQRGLNVDELRKKTIPTQSPNLRKQNERTAIAPQEFKRMNQESQERAIRIAQSAKNMGVSIEVSDRVTRIANAFDIDVEFVDLPDGSKGIYKDGKVCISANASSPALQVFKHEFTHDLENSKRYHEFRQFVFSNLRKTYDIGKYMDVMRDKYAQHGIDLSPKELQYEVVADAATRLLGDEDFIRIAYTKNAGIVQRAAAWVQMQIRKFRARGNPDIQELLEAQQIYSRVMRGGRLPSKKDSVNYMINPKFEQEYDAWDGKNRHKSFKIGTTSEALKSIGVEDRTIKWDSPKIIKIKEQHPEMTDQVIKQVPHVLEYPILVMQSKTHASRITMFGEIRDAKGDPVLAILELHPTDNKGLELDEIKLASAYGKSTNPQRFINTSTILYVDPNKNRTNTWLRESRLQLPIGLNQYGPIQKIAYPSRSINMQSQKNSPNKGMDHQGGQRSIKIDMEALAKEYGAIKPGMEPRVESGPVPKRTTPDTKVSKTEGKIWNVGKVKKPMLFHKDMHIADFATTTTLSMKSTNAVRSTMKNKHGETTLSLQTVRPLLYFAPLNLWGAFLLKLAFLPKDLQECHAFVKQLTRASIVTLPFVKCVLL